ncbi:MAG: ImmA/IrrE family metallo-endopeptidase, partial [Acidobacteriaceae bacterium]
IVKDLLEQTEAAKVDYVASVKMDLPAEDLARRITDWLDLSLARFRQESPVQAAFSYLRGRIEASGAYVLLLGNLGSYHTNIPSGVFRGYAIADPVAPFIVVNDQDSPVAWSFTMLHELAHLWLGATGLSGESIAAQLETYCNNVAGEILLPAADLDELRFLHRAPLQETVEAVDRFARQRNISRPMVAYKLLRLHFITDSRWRELNKHYKDEWVAAQTREVGEEKSEGGPSYYVLKRHRLGPALLDLVKNSLAEGFLTHTKAGQVLGVKPRNVDPLIYAPGMRGSQ